MGTAIDIRGHRFGRLVAIRDTGRRSQKNIIWELRCDCGGTVHRTAARLRWKASKGIAQACQVCTRASFGSKRPIKPVTKLQEFRCGVCAEVVTRFPSQARGAVFCSTRCVGVWLRAVPDRSSASDYRKARRAELHRRNTKRRARGRFDSLRRRYGAWADAVVALHELERTVSKMYQSPYERLVSRGYYGEKRQQRLLSRKEGQ